MDRQYYIDLIYKGLENDISTEEREQLTSWLETDADHRALKAQIQEIWDAESNYNPELNVNLDTAYASVQQKINSSTATLPKSENKTFSLQKWMVAASSVIGLCIVAWFLFNQNSGTHYLADGQIKEVTLPDGSIITLDKNSSIIVSNGFNSENRSLELDGRAYFNVKKNKDLPFIIEADHAIIEVLGTSFTITELGYKNSTQVDVSSGVVSVQASESDEERKLIEGQSTEVSAQGDFSSLRPTDQESWKSESIAFNDNAFVDVALSLSDYFNVDFQLSGPAPAECLITASFKEPTIDQVIEHLVTTYGITIDRKSSALYYIDPSACK